MKNVIGNYQHIIDDNDSDFDEWLESKWTIYAGHHGRGFNKTLEINLKGEWRVTDHRTEVYRGKRSEAIEAYNGITQRG